MRDLNATMFYKAKFTIRAKDPENNDLLWKLVMGVRSWITRKLNRNGREVVETDIKKWTHFKMGGKLYDLQDHNAFFAESVCHVNAESGKVSWACMIVEKPAPESGFAPREWTTEIGYQSDGAGQAELSYVVTYSDAPGFIGPCMELPTITVPNVIRRLLADDALVCSIGGSVLLTEPQKLVSGDYPRFEQYLMDPTRELPVLYISPKREDNEGRLLVSPKEVADTVLGNALVYYSEDLSFSEEMRYMGKDGYACAGGAIRVYFPGIDAGSPSDRYRHRFIPAREIEERGEEYVLSIFRRALAQDVHFYDSMFRVESCRALIAADKHRAHIEEVRKKGEGDVDEAMRAFLNESEKLQVLERQALEYLDQLDDLRRDNHSLNIRLEAMSDMAERCGLLESANRNVRAVSEFPNTPVKLARYFESVYPERIAFTERGYRSLEECTTKCELLWEVFYHIVNDLYMLVREDPAQAYKAFQNRTGWDCSRGEGSMTRKDSKMMRQYSDEYNGQEIDIEAHIKNGNKESDPRFVRIHFAYDPAVSDKILIGHCGKHLDNYSTRKVK